jgi:hypothetical protein
MIKTVHRDRLVAYLGPDGVLETWGGQPIGRYYITATWRTPRSYVSTAMSQVYATVDGRIYTGRSAGLGMSFRGRLIRRGRGAKS